MTVRRPVAASALRRVADASVLTRSSIALPTERRLIAEPALWLQP
jgi:hypothetical protein